MPFTPLDIPDSENPIVFCSRCGGYHRYWTFTKKDFDEMIAEASRRLAEAIDKQAAEAVIRAFRER